MSSTNRGGQRCEADTYPTPAWCVHRLLEACPLPGGAWLEPAGGDGAIVRAVNSMRSDVRWTACEIRPPPTGIDLLADACSTAPVRGDFLHWHSGARWDVCITNPPFSLAEEFVKRSLAIADNAALLLRLNFLGSEGRASFLRARPPDIYVLPNRPSFVGGKTDSCEYAWFVWRGNQRVTYPTHGGISVLATTPKWVRHV